MTRQEIKNAIENYLNISNTNYACLINGGWGIGKTYFYKKDLCSAIKAVCVPNRQGFNYKPIYISLIGLRSRQVLKEIIDERINPFYKYKKETSIQHEARIIENIINNETDNEYSKIIPENIVLCFDDLERLESDFFEETLGYINAFIEHNNSKVLFFCNEDGIKDEIKERYLKIKEKYIRHTFFIDASLSNIIDGQEIDYPQIFSNKDIILDYFKNGNSTNSRILLFIINQFPKVLNVIENTQLEQKYKNKVIELILKYYSFYSIEKNNGITIDILDSINTAKSTSLADIDFGWVNEKGNETLFDVPPSKEEELEEQKKVEEINNLKNKYFNNKEDLEFERFESIAEYILTGCLNEEKLKNEIQSIEKTLKAKEGTGEDELIKSISNIYQYSDEELPGFIQEILAKVEVGNFSLTSYLKIYSDLLWLSSFNIKAIKVDENFTSKFKSGVEKSLENKDIKYVPHLTEQFAWSGEDENANKFNDFKEFVEEINDSIRKGKEKADLNHIIQIMKDNDEKLLYDEISTNKSAYFTLEDARNIFNILKDAKPSIANSFYQAMLRRYENDGNIYSHMPRMEKAFIFELKRILQPYIKEDKGESAKIVPLTLLYKYLDEIIKRHELKNE